MNGCHSRVRPLLSWMGTHDSHHTVANRGGHIQFSAGERWRFNDWIGNRTFHKSVAFCNDGHLPYISCPSKGDLYGVSFCFERTHEHGAGEQSSQRRSGRRRRPVSLGCFSYEIGGVGDEHRNFAVVRDAAKDGVFLFPFAVRGSLVSPCLDPPTIHSLLSFPRNTAILPQFLLMRLQARQTTRHDGDGGHVETASTSTRIVCPPFRPSESPPFLALRMGCDLGTASPLELEKQPTPCKRGGRTRTGNAFGLSIQSECGVAFLPCCPHFQALKLVASCRVRSSFIHRWFNRPFVRLV
mmetsp:Transcript_904/g.5685  ORF Transcript_904/g.5685 Transcript_904/m.5685 type:complete len:297 (-) Transcript_904:115-1005(-)